MAKEIRNVTKYSGNKKVQQIIKSIKINRKQILKGKLSYKMKKKIWNIIIETIDENATGFFYDLYKCKSDNTELSTLRTKSVSMEGHKQ